MKKINNYADLIGKYIFVNLPAHNLAMAKIKIKYFMGDFVCVENKNNDRECFLQISEIKYFEVGE